LIVHFRDDETETLFHTGRSCRFRSIEKVAKRRLDYLDSAAQLGDLRVPPGNHLEALKGGRAGQHSIRVNDQYRVCFRWTDEGVHDVEITDYH